MLYQLEGTNTRVLGSMHLVPPGAKGWQDRVKSQCAWADEFAVEMRTETSTRLFTEPYARSVSLLPIDLREKIRAIWQDDLGDFARANLPGAMLFALSANIKRDLGVEAMVEELAGSDRAIHELESPAEFLSGFDNVAESEFGNAVRVSFKRRDNYRSGRLRALFDRWLANDTDGLHAVIMADIPSALVAPFFVSRNMAWAPRIAALARRPQKLLICVGAGHVCGPGNVLCHLAQEHGIEATEIRG